MRVALGNAAWNVPTPIVLRGMTEPPEDTGVQSLKHWVKSLWDMENELRFSAWSALTLDKEQARVHLSEARRHLNALLNEAEPTGHTLDQPPVLPDEKP